jgi:hypothetical protein
MAGARKPIAWIKMIRKQKQKLNTKIPSQTTESPKSREAASVWCCTRSSDRFVADRCFAMTRNNRPEGMNSICSSCRRPTGKTNTCASTSGSGKIDPVQIATSGERIVADIGKIDVVSR